MIYFILLSTLQLTFHIIFLYTGAGKSTLMVALLRICELDSGSIKIDGVDIRSVGLKTEVEDCCDSTRSSALLRYGTHQS